MSDKLLVKVWENLPEGGAALNLLQAIAEAANEDGNCYMNVEQLAASARMSYRSAHRALRQLRTGRWIVASRILGRGGRLVYQLNLSLLNRSRRRNHDAAAVAVQRDRPTGDTEVALLVRVQVQGATTE